MCPSEWFNTEWFNTELNGTEDAGKKQGGITREMQKKQDMQQEK